jgi:hypothetical protein
MDRKLIILRTYYGLRPGSVRENFLDFATVALSVVCDKYCPIID